MFCVDCGEEKPIFKNGSCLTCYLKNHQFTSGPAYIDIPYCVHCESLKYKNTWVSDSFEVVLNRFVKQLFTISKELRKVAITTSCEGEGHTLPCVVDISGEISGELISESHTVQVRLHPGVCDICSKQSGGYYEAVLQIRPWEKKLDEQRLQKIQCYIEDQVYLMQEKGNRKLFISDQKREHGGLDFFLSDKQAAASILKQAHDVFGGEITMSSKNMGMRGGQQVYRMTYLLRLYPFQPSDFLVKDEDIFLVRSLSKSLVHLVNLRTWSTQTTEAKHLENMAVYSGDDLVSKMIVVSQTEGEVQVMNNRTYEIIIIRKPKTITYDSEQIEVVEIDQRYYLLPPINNKS
jgi:nonsense-mediated mRNA decay protein 3